MNVAIFLEIKNEYTEHLVETLTPYIYEGLTSIYREAVKIADDTNNKDKTLLIFQKLLQSIDIWNQVRINEETNRIKQLSNTADYLDDLVKAVIKSNIILLTYSNNVSNIIGQSFYNTFATSSFIHRCYTECGKDSHNNPYLFFHDIDPMDYKRNQIIIQQHIQSGITRAVRKILPISMILKEYLINSINIIQEPPKIELLGTNGKVLEPTNPQLNNAATQLALPNISDKKIDEKMEKAIVKAIKTENNKTDQQKVQTIMEIDKLMGNIKPTKPIVQNSKSSSTKSSITKRLPALKPQNDVSESIPAGTKILSKNNIDNDDDDDEDDDNDNEDASTDENIMNLKFDEESTVNDSSNKKSLSNTTMSNRGMPKKNANKINLETSERVDPNKINLIEDYGMRGGTKKKKL